MNNYDLVYAKNKDLHVKVDILMMKKLDTLANIKGCKRSEIVRNSIEEYFDKLGV